MKCEPSRVERTVSTPVYRRFRHCGSPPPLFFLYFSMVGCLSSQWKDLPLLKRRGQKTQERFLVSSSFVNNPGTNAHDRRPAASNSKTIAHALPCMVPNLNAITLLYGELETYCKPIIVLGNLWLTHRTTDAQIRGCVESLRLVHPYLLPHVYIYATQPIQLPNYLNIYHYTLTTPCVTSTLNYESTHVL